MVTRYFALAEIMAANFSGLFQHGGRCFQAVSMVFNLQQLFYNLQDILFNPTAQRY